MAKQNNNGIGTRKTIIRLARCAGLLALIALLTACVWNLNEDTQNGTLTVSLSRGDGVAALDFTGFDTVSFFVAEAEAFRQASLSQIPLALRPGGLDEGRSFFIETFDPTPLADVAFSPFELPGGDIPETGLVNQIPRGSAQTFQPIEIGIPEPVTFENLVVGREYVVWIDGLPGEGPSVFGFGFVRIRSGAPTTVTIDLSGERFESFVDTLYARYIEPRIPRLDLSSFSVILYGGSGGATFSVFDIEGEPIGSPEVQEYASAAVVRLQDPELGFTVFFVGFFPDDSGEEDFGTLWVTLIENEGLLEPARSLYTVPEFNYDEGMSDFGVEPGMVVEIDGVLPFAFIFEGFDEFDFEFYDPNDPVVVTQMGFSGGPPSGGGTFNANVSGPAFVFGEISQFVSMTISGMSFTFGEVLEVFDETDFEFDLPGNGDFGGGPVGDLVFYVDETDEFSWAGLEAAPTDLWFDFADATEDPAAPWDSQEPGFLQFGGATGTAIGTGQSNYQIMLEIDGQVEAAIGVDSFNFFEGGNWFLPSLAELEAMYVALYEEGNLGSFTPALYWSSSEIDAQQAWAFDFNTGDSVPLAKGTPARIRPVRAFGDDFEFIPPEGFP